MYDLTPAIHRLVSTSAYWHLPRERNNHLQGTIGTSHNTTLPVGRNQTSNSDELIEQADIEQGASSSEVIGWGIQFMKGGLFLVVVVIPKSIKVVVYGHGCLTAADSDLTKSHNCRRETSIEHSNHISPPQPRSQLTVAQDLRNRYSMVRPWSLLWLELDEQTGFTAQDV
ncbi:uncharacterized protein EURHEDRAFT_404855 [Aspergillus ruber CBS 135680]|uniref:Uncharacterized protein n=1 Tax=Aspergillus ruber (strain CBS 135680) TaxID=1388766 RepID=A0A017S6V6_ASPRC|nr:uncharacterized protein EURHEDRAFT_404855 [Aspergillus ruber CBS 135680]EYE92687.1 hypothetical protein EURHEDRAFT_404855 [Aspergillus ruber CBS 135680]